MAQLNITLSQNEILQLLEENSGSEENNGSGFRVASTSEDLRRCNCVCQRHQSRTFAGVTVWLAYRIDFEMRFSVRKIRTLDNQGHSSCIVPLVFQTPGIFAEEPLEDDAKVIVV